MITKMDRYTLFSPGSYSSELISGLQNLGVVDIRRSHKPVDSHSEELLERAEGIRMQMTGSDLKKVVADKAEAISKLQDELESARAWGEFDSSVLENLSAAGYRLHFHIAPASKFDTGWGALVPLEIIADDGKKILFVTVGTPADGNEIPGEIPTPRSAGTIEADIAVLKKEKEALDDSLASLPGRISRMKEEYDGIMRELDAYLAGKASIAGNDGASGELSQFLDIFEGFAPSGRDKELKSFLDTLPIYYIAEPAKDDDTPIQLHNNWFARQFEVFTGMYGMPVYGEFDPTPILAPFFLLFFSMCMGDAGYGILLVIIALFLKEKMPESGLGKMHSLITLLGIGTFVTGFFLGTFFGINLYEAAWMPGSFKKVMLVEGNIGKIAGFDPQIVLALGIGVFHICLAMVVKTACATSRAGFINSLSTWGWTLLVVGGVITAALAIGGLLGGEALRITVITLAAVSCIGIFLLNKPGRNPLANIGAGLWDSYNMATGLLGDTLSYLRLYALGLAGGMLGGAFNNLAGMILGEDPTWQWLPFVLVIVIGHALNLAMSCLGAFVHPLRLSYVEYFKNSGYEGKGVKYQPLTKETNKNQIL